MMESQRMVWDRDRQAFDAQLRILTEEVGAISTQLTIVELRTSERLRSVGGPGRRHWIGDRNKVERDRRGPQTPNAAQHTHGHSSGSTRSTPTT